jgi:hypothetical protein
LELKLTSFGFSRIIPFDSLKINKFPQAKKWMIFGFRNELPERRFFVQGYRGSLITMPQVVPAVFRLS